MLINKSFTLIEVLVAALIITMGAGGAFALIQRTIIFTTNAGFQLEASYLAQEGMEIVRNIRDTNLLKIHKGGEATWTNGLGLIECQVGCQVDYTEGVLVAYQDTFLQFDNNLYSYTVGTNSIYKRKIIITPREDHILEVLVEVIWEERNRSHKVQAVSELYNWLPAYP